MERWMNVELSKADSELFRQFLKGNNIKYETSEVFNLIHFEVFVNVTQVKGVNDFLMSL